MKPIPGASLAAVALLAALAGCSSDSIYGPQTFFPGSNRHGWSDCDKFAPTAEVSICAGYTYPIGGLDVRPVSYTISYNIASDQHLLLVVFDAKGVAVRKLLDQDQAAVPAGTWLTVDWNFTNDAGTRVAPGDYRAYFRAGDFVSSSDVAVP